MYRKVNLGQYLLLYNVQCNSLVIAFCFNYTLAPAGPVNGTSCVECLDFVCDGFI